MNQIATTLMRTTRASGIPWRRISASAIATIVAQGVVAVVLLTMYGVQPETVGVSRALVQELPAPDPALVDDAAWQELTLPAKLCGQRCTSKFKAYRLYLDIPSSRSNQSLYVKLYDGSMAAYLNSQKIGQTGSMRDPVADMTYQPAYFDIPDSLWIAQDNTLDIIVASLVKGGGRLTPPYVGERSELLPAFEASHGLTVSSLAIVNGILLVFLFASAVFYFAADRDPLFIWFGLLLVFCICRNLNILLPEWPLNPVVRNTMYLSATLGVLLTAGGFISRAVSSVPTRIDFWLVAAWLPATAIVAIGLTIDMWGAWFAAIGTIRILTLALGTWWLLRFLYFSRTLSPVVQAGIFGLLSAGLTLMLHDSIGSMAPRILVFQTSNLAALPVVLCFCVVLANRYREYLLRVRSQNRLLRAAVNEKEAELANTYAALGKAREAQVLVDERQRIMQDMHDGVGGRLAALLQSVRRQPSPDDRLTRELQSGLNDLRLIIDSLDETTSGDLGFALGSFRQKTEPWLNDHGVELDWRIDIADSIRLGPEKTLQLYRILQESLNNVVRHAGADRVTIESGPDDEGIRISVFDNGRGISDESQAGRGLGIMRRRAESIDARLSIESEKEGVRVELILPSSSPDQGGQLS